MLKANKMDKRVENICYLVLAVGAGLLFVALYFGFARGAESNHVYPLIGGSVVLFSIAILLLFVPLPEHWSARRNITSQPLVQLEPQSETKGSQLAPMSSRQPEVSKTSSPNTEKISDDKSPVATVFQPTPNIQLMALMKMTLGEILVDGLVRSPELVGQIVITAISKAGAISQSQTAENLPVSREKEIKQ